MNDWVINLTEKDITAKNIDIMLKMQYHLEIKKKMLSNELFVIKKKLDDIDLYLNGIKGKLILLKKDEIIEEEKIEEDILYSETSKDSLIKTKG